MTKREIEERKKIEPGLEIVAINGRLLEPRTLLQAHNLVLSGGTTVDMTLRRLSDIEGKHMKSLLQKMQEEGKVFVAKRPSHRNKSIHSLPCFVRDQNIQ